MTEPEVEKIVSVGLDTDMKAAADVRIHDIEVDCLTRQEQYRAELKTAQAALEELRKNIMKIAEDEFRKDHPEIVKLEESLKKLFKENVKVVFQAVNEAHAGKPMSVTISVSASGAINFSGQETKDTIKAIDTEEKKVEDLEEKLVEVKKQLSMMPAVERGVKAAIGRYTLSQSKTGKEILAHIEKVTIPGLPAPKK